MYSIDLEIAKERNMQILRRTTTDLALWTPEYKVADMISVHSGFFCFITNVCFHETFYKSCKFQVHRDILLTYAPDPS